MKAIILFETYCVILYYTYNNILYHINLWYYKLIQRKLNKSIGFYFERETDF